jgi:hypothetical protein
LSALAVHTQFAVAMFLVQVSDGDAGGLDDPQPTGRACRRERSRRGVDRLAGRGEHRFERSVAHPQGRELGDTRGRRTCSAGDRSTRASVNTCAVEAGHHRQPPRHGRRLVAAGLLHPPHKQLDRHPRRGERIDGLVSAPRPVAAQTRRDVGHRTRR